MESQIKHRGIVSSIHGDRVRVTITQHSACSSCKAKHFCSSSESKDKVIDIPTPLASSFSPAEEVVVMAALSQGSTAVVLAFVIPLVLFVGALVAGLKLLLWSEPLSIGVAFLFILFYYLMLALNRRWVSSKFAFSIEKLSDMPAGAVSN